MNLELLGDGNAKKTFFRASKATSPNIVNALRRTIIAGLPTFAADEVHFYENNSPMYNEYIANRIGLIPLTYEDSLAEDAEITLSLDAEAVDEPRTVYSREITSSDPTIKVYAENVPIIKLAKGQRLRFEAVVRKGKANEHAKFQSALASYGLAREFKLADKCKKCSAAIKMREKELADKIPASQVPEESLLCDDCAEKLAGKDASEDDFIFFVESFNNLTAVQQLQRALKELDAQLDLFVKELK